MQFMKNFIIVGFLLVGLWVYLNIKFFTIHKIGLHFPPCIEPVFSNDEDLTIIVIKGESEFTRKELEKS